MTSDFETVIERLRVLSAIAVAEEGDIKGSTLGEGPHLIGTPDMDDYRSEPRPCKAALLAFLDALPVAQVFLSFHSCTRDAKTKKTRSSFGQV